jgi:hypothetical protein
MSACQVKQTWASDSHLPVGSGGHFAWQACCKIFVAGISGYGTATVTRRKVAGMEVVFMPGFVLAVEQNFQLFLHVTGLAFSAASNAFMGGPAGEK